MKNLASTVAIAFVLAGIAPPMQAYAQNADQAPPATETADGIEDVVVTAEKRPITGQRTPSTLSVLTSEVLARNGVANLVDVASIAPSVSITQTGAAPILAVRGVSSRDVTEIGDPAIAISIDGFNLQRATGLNTAFFDLDRIEVLRGPQGTLLGRNATGGALNIISARPSLTKAAAYVGGEVGNYGLYATKGMINLPLSEDFAIRASFQTRDHSGYRNTPIRRGDDEHSKAIRLHALYKPADSRFDILLTGEYAQNRGVGTVIQGMPWTVFTAANAPPGFIAGDISLDAPDRGNGKTYFSPNGGYVRYNVYNIRSEVNYDLDFATLTYQGGYRHLDFDRKYAFGGNPNTIQRNLSFEQAEKLNTWNHELRLTSNGEDRFKWVVGGFYFREENDFVGLFTDYPGQADLNGRQFIIQRFTYPDIVAKALAAFGQASFEILPDLRIEGGARYSHDRKSRTTNTLTTNLATFQRTRCDLTNSCVYVTETGSQSAESKKTTVHAGLNYQVTPRNLLFAKIDTGYKAGGFTNISSYLPETITAYEIGTKNRFFNNKVQVNASAYLYNYSNQQINQAVINSSGGVSAQILNAGKSRYKGVELDVAYAPTGADRFDLYVAYLDARFVDFSTSTSGQLLRLATLEGAAVPVRNASGTIVSYNYQLSGKKPPQAPAWSLNAGYQHDFDAFDGTFTPRIQTHVESKSYFQFYNLGTDRQDGYMRSDIIVTYRPRDANWTFSTFVRNLEDKLILANAALPTSATYGSYREQYQAPRTYGANFTFNW